MATLPASESTLRAMAPVFVPASERECIVCYASDGDGVACQDGHWTCAGCFGRYVRDCCEKLAKINLIEGEAAEAERENNVMRGHDLAGRISCPKADVDAAGEVVRCAAPPFTDREVAMHADEETFEIYFEGRGKLPMARAVTSALQEWQEGAGALRLLFPNARMCGQCSYGPVDHAACADLTAHHGEPGNPVHRREDGPIAAMGLHALFARARLGPSGSSRRIDNACPRCGWFAPTISAWPMWNGVLATPEDDAAEEFAERRRRRDDELRREYEARRVAQRDMLADWDMQQPPTIVAMQLLHDPMDHDFVDVHPGGRRVDWRDWERRAAMNIERDGARRAAMHARQARLAADEAVRAQEAMARLRERNLRAAEAQAWEQAEAFGHEMRRLQQEQAQAQAGRRSLAEVMFGEPQAAPGRREQRRLRRQRG